MGVSLHGLDELGLQGLHVAPQLSQLGILGSGRQGLPAPLPPLLLHPHTHPCHTLFDNNNNNSTGVPGNARYLLGMSYPSPERQHVLTFETLGSVHILFDAVFQIMHCSLWPQLVTVDVQNL